jgi:hypothetical protein
MLRHLHKSYPLCQMVEVEQSVTFRETYGDLAIQLLDGSRERRDLKSLHARLCPEACGWAFVRCKEV